MSAAAGANDWIGREAAGVALHVLRQIARHRVSVIAAGVAFYAMLALFPGLAALTALYGLAFDTRQVTDQVGALGELLPADALNIILRQLRDLTESNRTALGYGAAGALLLAWWSASRAVKTLMEALNFAYGERERRGFIRLNALALLLTLGVILGTAASIGAVVAVPVAADFLGLDPLLSGVLRYARWPLITAAMIAGLSIMYRYGPSRSRPPGAPIGAGAIAATLLWLAGSWLFALYVEHFGRFNQAYGSIGAVVALLIWFLISAYAILLGAELDGALERRRRGAESGGGE